MSALERLKSVQGLRRPPNWDKAKLAGTKTHALQWVNGIARPQLLCPSEPSAGLFKLPSNGWERNESNQSQTFSVWCTRALCSMLQPFENSDAHPLTGRNTRLQANSGDDSETRGVRAVETRRRRQLRTRTGAH